MKSKLLIVISLLFVLGVDGLVMAEKMNGDNSGAAFNPDGVAVTNPQRRRKRRRRYRAERHPVTETGVGNGAMPDQPSPPPPVVEEVPVMSAPPPVSSPGGGASKRSSAPRIKPPTVNIKPPTE
jgi:hypothetical protein